MTLEELRSMLPGQPPLWDPQTRGLHCIANQDGSKSFLLYYRTKDGRQRRPKIGALGEITLGEARKRAKALLERVARGEDPKGDWNDKRAEMTVNGLWERVWAAHWGTSRYQVSGWGKEAKRLFLRVIEPDFGNARLSEVTAFKVREWHRRRTHIPYSANRSLSVFSKMFQYAEEQELRPQHSNPCLLVKKHPEAKRKRFATEEEISQIGAILEREVKKQPAGVAFIYLLMFSGSRPKAIADAKWDQLKEFQLEGQAYGVLTLRGKTTAKTGEEERIILPPQAMRAIARLPRIEGQTITSIKMPRRLWRKIKTEVGCHDLWARDWRRTFATVGMSGGVGKDVIGELLNHRSTQTTSIYAKLVDTSRLQAVTQIANKMESLFHK